MSRRLLTSLCVLVARVGVLHAQSSATQPASRVEFPNVVVDLDARQVRVACESLALVDAPLEFLCVTKGGSEHESVLRTSAKPSHIHAALLMLGLEPGSPAMYRPATNNWTAPFGPPVRISCEWTEAGSGKVVRVPAERTLKATAQNKGQPTTWIFAGSHVRPDGVYLADLTGYVVTLVNFEHALIDVPKLASSSNDTLEWQTDLSVVPPRGAAVTMILEPIADAASQPTTAPASEPAALGEVDSVEREIAAYRDQWRVAVSPHASAMRDAAKAHYDVIATLRRRQQTLVDEADHVERLIDELERQYGEMTTPKPN